MKIIFFICAIFMMYSTNAQNQSTVDSVKIAVKQLFEAMRNNDSALLVNSFADSAILQTITPKSDGAVVVKTESISRFGSSVKHAEKGSWDEQAEINAVHIDGPLASVWAPYRFFYKGNFSHCGANSIQLIRQQNGWKIQYLTDTRRRDCK